VPRNVDGLGPLRSRVGPLSLLRNIPLFIGPTGPDLEVHDEHSAHAES
jgi:hypothetical protein